MAGRYEISDNGWALIEDIVSPPQRTGRPRRDDRQVLNGIFWILCSGAKWRDLPERYGHPPMAGLFVKVRFDDFSLTTLESRGLTPDAESYTRLLEQAWAWARARRPVCLLGVGVRLVPEEARQQLALPL
ncbi:putative transposase of IS4/5 family DUF4096 [Halomonas ventosae]|uniref:Putative transposase of IS4/5 family DUF4096 n=1 Tax=Halomonas ventosae TaxID=229007 RepID=A0A4R6ZY18_9GAMM|nr:putative transposase of IS4/5 family DUF4096 [Halomonas ventosae]